MRNLTAVFVLSLASLVGCGFLKKADPDAGSDAAVVAVDNSASDAAPEAAAGTPTGKNAPAIARFGTEVALNEPKVIGQTTTPRVSPNTGAIVTTLHPGTGVTRIATNAGNSLIVFPDPNVPTDNLMGWVTDAAFSTAVIALHHDAGAPVASVTAAPAFTCPPGKVAVARPGQPACRTACTKDADCPSRKQCVNQSGPAGFPIKACQND